MTGPTDLAKIRALLRVVSVTDGSVTLSGQSAAMVADAIAEVEKLRSDRDRLQRLCDKTALAAGNRVLQRVHSGERLAGPKGGDPRLSDDARTGGDTAGGETS